MDMTATALFRESERRRLVRLCATISGDHDAAEDLAQETLLEAWRNQHKLTDPAGADRWLTAVARNVCLRWTTRRRDVPVPEVPEQAVEVDLARNDLAHLLDGALALLPATSRDVLLQKYVHDRSNGEIARQLGITDDAVSMRLTRGKLALRRVLDAEEWRETRLWCVSCGAHRLVMRRERAGAAVAFRCPSCDGDHRRSAVFPLDNPFFHGLVGSLERPTAMFGRVAPWACAYWAGGDGAEVHCTRCGGATTVHAHTRLDTGEPLRGLFVRCATCGEELWSSLVGVAMAMPAVREVRRRAPRTAASLVETRGEIVVRFGDVDTAFERPTFRLIA
jgi:RNA polymerase sigma factor (sigma-70 family)